MRFMEMLREWYQGRYVAPPPNDPNSGVIFISAGHYEKPLFARFLQILGHFWLAHWKWIIGTSLAVAGLAVALTQ